MPPKGKPKARAFKANSSSAKSTVSSSSTAEPPIPFARAPKKLEPLLSKLDKAHIYITHVDSKPRDFKQKIFLVPVLMNIVIVGLILWRIKTIGPYYMKICYSLMGQKNEMSVDVSRTPMDEILKEILRRGGSFVLDLLIYMLVWPWPRDFFAGTTIGNPIAWRFSVGFRNQEIIVRRSRRWYFKIVDIVEEGDERNEVMEIVKRAVDPIWMNEKTGYLMLNKEWDLDWRMMVKATKMIDKNILGLNDFKTTVLLHNKEFGWLCIELVGAGGSAKEEEGRRKIVAFKDELTALGKENLFFKWIELVQYESSQPGGFGPEQQQKTMVKAQELFERQGVDFEAFWKKVGGMGGMPGMDDVD